jgi:CBS domain-containing protein
MAVTFLLRDAARPLSMRSGDTVKSAVRNMIDFDTGAIAVVDEDRRAIGVFSKKDLLGKVVAVDRDANTTALGDVMSTDIVIAADTLTVDECLRLMREYRIRHLVLVDQSGRYTGLVSLCELLENRIFELNDSLQSMESYFNDSLGG